MTVEPIKRTNLPPGPKAHFFFGNLAKFNSDPLGFFTNSAKEYGDIVYLPDLQLSGSRVYMLNHPDYIEAALVTKSSHFSKNQQVLGNLQRLFGNGIIVSEGDFWRRQRRLIQPGFHRDRISNYTNIMVNYTNRMLAKWEHGEIRDISHEMTRLTMEIVAKTLFDANLTGKGEGVGSALTTIMKYFDKRTSNLILALLPDSFPIPDNLRYKKAVQSLDNIIHEIIEQRRASSEDKGDLLSMLMHIQDEDGSRMTNQQLRDEVMNIFLAGNETTSLALTWTFYLLSQHPEVEAKLATELQSVPTSLTVADIPRLPYTEMVVMEAMRLYPPGWFISRTVIQECEIDGYLLPVGTSVIMSQWVMHRDPRYFEKPEVFIPERWADGLAKKIPTYAYFPFGGGPRVCIGRSFAIMEAVLLLATIVRRFRLTLTPDYKVTPWPSFTLRPKNGLNMLLSKVDVG